MYKCVERGEVLVSVLTESEGLEGLHSMATGLIQIFASNIHCEIHDPLFAQVREGQAGSPAAAVH